MKQLYKTKAGKSYSINDSDEIYRGGEGRIMSIKNDATVVAKLYHENIVPISEKQFSFLSALQKSLFVVPQALLYNAKNSVAGFIMEYISNDFFPLSSLFSKNFCLKIGISEAIKKEIAKKLIESVQIAHNQHIVIGDLNQYNVLINPKGEIKFIDTDSYQTPAHKHSGMLLDDIRDYLYGGTISENSDFFALSVMVFYAFTHVHPFKGIHSTYKKLSDRMIHKLPVLLNLPELKVPKVYRPISDKNLVQQFESMYVKGDRFLLSLKGIKQIAGKLQPAIVTQFQEKDLTITSVLQNTLIKDIRFNLNLGYIETEDNFLVYDAKNKGYLLLKHTISKKFCSAIFLGNKNIILQNKEKLYHYQNEATVLEIKNFSVSGTTFSHQFGEIVLLFAENVMYKLFLDDVIGTSIRNMRTTIFGQGFSHYSGLLQNIGGLKRAFYNAGKNVATVKINRPVKEIHQQGNVACIQYIVNNKVENRYLLFDGLKTIESAQSNELLTDFAFLSTSNTGHGFIFEPADDGIKIIRTQDFQTISLLECSLISTLSKLQYAGAGIIALESENVYLLNKQ